MTSHRLRGLGLTLPLIAFLGVTFVAPLVAMFTRSIHEPLVADAIPQTLALLQEWDGQSTPDEELFQSLAMEGLALHRDRSLGAVATRVNRLESGMRSTIVGTFRKLNRLPVTDLHGTTQQLPRDSEQFSIQQEDGTHLPEGYWQAAMIDADRDWSEPASWLAIRRAGERFTFRHYLNALDLDRDATGTIVAQPPERRIYLVLLWRTLVVSTVITMICLLLGYPVAYLIANAPPHRSTLFLMLVLVPFWTSLLVRTTSWIVLLQTHGVINDLLTTVGLISDAGRIAMIYNMTGTIVAMVHVLLPFMILPLYSVMSTIPRLHLQAAESLGATPLQAFLRVYWPQSLPGVAAGSLLVFILSIGYYITPALVGGRTGQLISNLIAYHMQQSLNWGLAAALSVILLVCVAVLYIVYSRLVGVERMRLG